MPQTEYNARLKLYFPCITTELDITRIGEAAFMGLDALTEVEIADSVTSIGAYAFNYCGMLTKFEFPKNVSKIEKPMFWGCDSLSEVVIPEGVTTIGERAFDGCESLKTLSIPMSVTKIGYAPFSNQLQELSLSCGSKPASQLNVAGSKVVYRDHPVLRYSINRMRLQD